MRTYDATSLMEAMHRAVLDGGFERRSSDEASPQKAATQEAEPGRSFDVTCPLRNIPQQRQVDLRWALANTLHFFSAREDAKPLFRYCKQAARFLDADGRWDGAYGAIAVPQLRACVELLHRGPFSRRAVVSMGGPELSTLHRPACWNFLHLLRCGPRLDLLVYQRSLNLFGVMPYDLVVLSNVMRWAAAEVGATVGCLRWTVGSLHTVGEAPSQGSWGQPTELLIPPALLGDADACWASLEDETLFDEVLDVSTRTAKRTP